YMSHVSSRSVDPRPRVAQFGIKLKPEITYSANNQQITIGGFWGKGDEDNSVIYKNRNYGLSLTFPERIYYINQGYGFIVMKDTANLRRYDRFSGISTSYSLSKDRYYVGAYAQLLRQSQDNTHEMRFRNNYYSRTNFELSTYKAGLL